MATNNAINLSNSGVAYYDGSGVFTGISSSTVGNVLTANSSGSPSFQLPLSPTQFIVDPAGTGAYYTTIQSAINAAASAGAPQDVFITDGTYVEDLTLSPGINLTAFSGAINNVHIQGKMTYTGGGTTHISNIDITNNQTSPDYFLVFSGSSSGTITFTNCNFTCSTYSGINFTNSNSASTIHLSYSAANVTINTATFLISTSPAQFLMYYTNIQNSIGSTIASTCADTLFQLFYGEFNCALSLSGASRILSDYSTYTVPNTTALTISSSSGNNRLTHCNLSTGTATSLVVSSTNTMTISECVITSSNTVAISSTSSNFYIYNTTYTNIANINISGTHYAGTVGLVGVSPLSGIIGEQIRSFIASGSAISLTTATPTNITSISLTPGTWDVSAMGLFSGTLTGTQSIISISSTSATLSTDVGDATINFPLVASSSSDLGLTIPSYRVFLTSTTTYYLVAQTTFSVGTATGYGRISATRVA